MHDLADYLQILYPCRSFPNAADLTQALSLLVEPSNTTFSHTLSIRCDAQFLIKRPTARLPPQEVYERLHFILGSAALKDGVSVAAAFDWVHRVLGKDGVEHVR